MTERREARLAAIEANYSLLGLLIEELKDELRSERPPSKTGWDKFGPSLNVAEACEATGLKIDTFRTLMREEGFPGTKVGRRWVIDRDRLRNWMLGRNPKPKATVVPFGKRKKA